MRWAFRFSICVLFSCLFDQHTGMCVINRHGKIGMCRIWADGNAYFLRVPFGRSLKQSLLVFVVCELCLMVYVCPKMSPYLMSVLEISIICMTKWSKVFIPSPGVCRKCNILEGKWTLYWGVNYVLLCAKKKSLQFLKIFTETDKTRHHLTAKNLL